MHLTEHFKARWLERVGGDVPDREQVTEMLRDAVVLQKFRSVYTARGRALRVLGSYWVPSLDLVIKVDVGNKRVVTVITGEVNREC